MSKTDGEIRMKGLRQRLEILLNFDKHDGWAMASHVALSLMIAVFPFLIFAVSLAGLLGTDGLSEEIINLVFEYWPDTIAAPIVNEIEAVVASANVGFLTFGIVLAVFFASNGIEAIRVALNRAYGDSDKRSIIEHRLQSILFVVVGAIMMLFISALLVFVPLYLSLIEIELPTVHNWLLQNEIFRWFAAFCFLIFFVFASHRWLPGQRRPLVRIWPGILLTLVLWVVIAYGFSIYLENFANYSATYAGLAGIMTALIFLYLMAAIFIIGAEYNSAREEFDQIDTESS